jgi:hypothetical protein
MMDKFKAWYAGSYVPYENQPGSHVVFMGGNYEGHWMVRAARGFVEVYLREWKWVGRTSIALGGLVLAMSRTS